MKHSARGRRPKKRHEPPVAHSASAENRQSPFLPTADPPQKRAWRLLAAAAVWLACIVFLAYLTLTE